ncbi:MAG: DUF2073 domain-containing protein [Candidatus Woesearchaeota archaeon]
MLTLQFIPYIEIESLDSEERINKLLALVQSDAILLLEGRLRPHEETKLIQKTMQAISKKFKGIELSVIYPEQKNEAFFARLKQSFINLVLGNRRGMTIIGPANVVEEIKQDPDKIQLFTKDVKAKRTVKKPVRKTSKKSSKKKTTKKTTRTRLK